VHCPGTYRTTRPNYIGQSVKASAVTLERLWAGWRARYVSDEAGRATGCFLCDLDALDEPVVAEATLVLERCETTVTVMNLYPYGSGHLLVAPRRHEADLLALDDVEAVDMMAAIRRAVRAVQTAYEPDGVNVGFNLGRAAGAGVPDHLHAHVLARWSGDTNFMTSLAETRVLPESLEVGWQKLRAAWPVA
jgi:diadenosine tetraphosphate (Ap4A) HIT family hydrolase